MSLQKKIQTESNQLRDSVVPNSMCHILKIATQNRAASKTVSLLHEPKRSQRTTEQKQQKTKKETLLCLRRKQDRTSCLGGGGTQRQETTQSYRYPIPHTGPSSDGGGSGEATIIHFSYVISVFSPHSPTQPHPPFSASKRTLPGRQMAPGATGVHTISCHR